MSEKVVNQLVERQAAALASPKAYTFVPDQNWDGNDGSWSTFIIQVGTPPQYFRVLPSINGRETWVPAPIDCQRGGAGAATLEVSSLSEARPPLSCCRHLMPDLHALRISPRCAIIAFPSRGIVLQVLAQVNFAVEAIQGRAIQLDATGSVEYVRPHTLVAIAWEMTMMPLPTS